MNPSSATAASSPTPPCPRCGAPIPADAPEGLCPRCVAAGNFLTGSLFAGAATRADAESAAASAPAPTPEDLARFFPQLEIQRTLGRGGMGVVYLARQKSLDRLVALKLLAPERVDDPAFAARFATEARALARLHHPHIVTVHDFGAVGGYYYLLMEYVDGLNLRQLQQAGRVEPREALAIVPQICDALQYAHDQGVVHRDIKPENILVDRRGSVKVADFGLAKLARPAANGGADDNRAAAENVVMGTPAYMSPEQRSHPDRVDHRTDIYALGAVLYEMLTGARPGTPPQNPSRDVRIDVRLDEVVLRALAHEPALRWQQASEVKTRLETIAASPAPTTHFPTRRFVAGTKTRWVFAVISVVACIVALVAARLGVSERHKTVPSVAPAETTAPSASAAPAPVTGEPIDISPWHTPRELGAKSLTRALDTLHGDHVFDGLAFHVDGQITFAGDAFSKNNPKERYPGTVPEIPLGDRRFDELHLLHVTYYENPHGEAVANVRLHYADGDIVSLPIVYGVHLRDWSHRAAEERERLEDPDSKIVFRDLKPNDFGATARIFKTRLANPRPGNPVRSLRIIAAPGLASYSLLAATTANTDPARAPTPAVANGEAERVFDQELRLRVLDGRTGAPVVGALIKTRGEYLGSYIIAQPLRTDAAGEAVFRYARSGRLRARHLGFELVGTPDYADQYIGYDLVPPRVAYFFVTPKAAGDNGPDTRDLPDHLPAWRHDRARALLREYGLNRLAIRERTTPDESQAWGIEHQIEADLGSLVLGTRGEVLWRASRLRSASPGGTADDRTQYDREGRQLLHAPAEQARKDFLAWLWAQVSPGEPALPDLTQFRRPAETPTRPVDKMRLQALLDAYQALIQSKTGDTEEERLAAWSALRQSQAAIVAELLGTDIDLAMERAEATTTERNAMPISAHNDGELEKLVRQAADRGQLHELERLRHQREMHRYEIPDLARMFLHASDLVPSPPAPVAP